jgi:quinol monooxygenase YgiN
MIIITGSIKTGSVGEIVRIKNALLRRAQKSRQDAGNIEYVFSQNLEDPTEILLTEKWDDEASLQAHLKVPDDEFNAVLKTAKIERALVTAYEAANARELMKR